jgi:hypothetical protein
MKYGRPTVAKRSSMILQAGWLLSSGFQLLAGVTGMSAATTSRARCTTCCILVGIHFETTWAYKYPPKSSNWKTSMQVVQTAGLPPNQGRIVLLVSGCT